MSFVQATSPVSRYLAIYLKDHHAAGSAGARLATRIAREATLDPASRAELSNPR